MKACSQYQKGFTLIEMMIVVAIIGILVSVVLPAYQTYTIRAKIIETTRFSGAAKTLIWEEYFTHGSMPVESTNASHEVERMMLTSKYITSSSYTRLDDSNASLQVTFKNLGMGADGSSMTFLFQTDSTAITIDCKGGTLPDIYRPHSCRSNT